MNDRTAIGFRLLNEFQRDFPLHPTPYALIAERLGLDENTVMSAYAEGLASGVVSRIGAVFAPNRIGSSTLAAIRVPAERLDAVAAQVSAHAAVNHNYAREHDWNLWFVVTASGPDSRQAALETIARETGLPVIALPLRDEFHIDLGFDLNGGQKRVAGAARCPPRTLSAAEEALVRALENGLSLETRPFAALGARIGMAEETVLAQLRAWQDEGVLKRFGVVVRHHELGYTANAMCVWDVPDAEATLLGCRLAGLDGVTLCYRRDRAEPHWPFNLYCMIHGKSRQEVHARHAEINTELGLDRYPGAVLFSVRRFKQCGARYAERGAA
ncbi:MAG: Lrp/AsnC family transcriptional regulator [Hyphomicrobiales bacterium]|nr:Lrp/AsnC family transcriptional regulator [Hyphomicrobiales bacterium]